MAAQKISLPDQFKDGVRVPKSRDNVSLSTKESKIDLIMQDRIAAMLPSTLIGRTPIGCSKSHKCFEPIRVHYLSNCTEQKSI